jgi:hypothetical protein
MKSGIAWIFVVVAALGWACSSESIDGNPGYAGFWQNSSIPSTQPGSGGSAGFQPSAGGASGAGGWIAAAESSPSAGNSATAAGSGGQQTAGTGGINAAVAGKGGGAGIAGTSAATAGNASTAITVEDAIASITEKDIRADLTYLASDELQGRKAGSTGDQKAMDYVVGKFKQFDLEGKNGEYTQPFTTGGTNTANLIGILPGNDPTLKDQVIVVGGHHDHVGVQQFQIYNGADDNASGVSVVIAVAKAISKFKGKLKRTVVLMSFGAEELGILGSKYYCDNPWFPMNKTVFMINLDMVGHAKDNKLTASTESQVAQGLLTEICKKYTICNAVAAPEGSDHDSFADKGVPYHVFHTDLHDCYHEACDKIDTIDMPGVTDVAKITFELTYRLANADQSPRSNFEVPASRKVGRGLDHGKAPFLVY